MRFLFFGLILLTLFLVTSCSSDTKQPECTPNSIRDCSVKTLSVEPDCKVGSQSCTKDGFWGLCKRDVELQKETCDGKDNDCDGVIDNGCGIPRRELSKITLPKTTHISFSPNLKRFSVSFIKNNDLHVYDKDGVKISEIEIPNDPFPCFSAISPNDINIVAYSYMEFFSNHKRVTRLKIYDTKQKKEVSDLTTPAMKSGVEIAEFRKVEFSPDGRYLFGFTQTMQSKGLLIIWNVKEKKVIHQKKYEKVMGFPQKITFSSDGKYMAFGSFFLDTTKIHLWSLSTMKELMTQTSKSGDQRDRVQSLQFKKGKLYVLKRSKDKAIYSSINLRDFKEENSRIVKWVEQVNLAQHNTLNLTDLFTSNDPVKQKSTLCFSYGFFPSSCFFYFSLFSVDKTSLSTWNSTLQWSKDGKSLALRVQESTGTQSHVFLWGDSK